MAFDAGLAARLRADLAARGLAVHEQPMMGALVMMLDGNMCCGVTGARLMVRLGPGAGAPEAEPLRIGARETTGFYTLAPEQVTGAGLALWVGRAIDFTRSLPPKS